MEERIPVSDSLGSIGGGVAASFLASAAWNHKIDRHELAIEREHELRNQIQNRRHSFIPIRAGLENAGKFRLVGFGANSDAGSGWLTSNDWMSTKSLGTLPQNAGSIPIPKHNQTDLRAEYLKGPSRSNASAIGIYHAPPQTHAGGGAAMQPHGGGSYSPTQTGAGAITPLQLPAPLSSSMNTSAIIASLTANQVLGDPRGAASVVSASSNGPVVSNSSPASTTAQSTTGAGSTGSASEGASVAPALSNQLTTIQTESISSPTVSGGAVSTPGFFNPTPSQLNGGSNSAPLGQFPYFQLYTLDNNTGNVIFPGYEQLATLGGSVDLKAQVSGAQVSSYSWNTSGLTDAGSISGSNTYNLTFQWNTTNYTVTTNSVTLTVTDTNGNQESQTYTFIVPTTFGSSGGGSVGSGGGSGNVTWPVELSPSLQSPNSADFADQFASVNANSGALDTSINLPSYNPNIPGLSLSYNSLAADPQPIVVVHHTLNASLTTPSQVSAQLTFNGTAGSTYYWNTSTLNPGDVQQLALQANASTLATGRYNYSVSVTSHRSTNNTTTYNDTTTIVNDSTSAFGAGWTLSGLESIVPASGGVIVDLGGGQSLWFANNGTGGYTTPVNDPQFSTLVANTGGGWIRTLRDGLKFKFNASGQQTSTVDLNGNTTTYAYNSSGQLTSITDPFGQATTFAYSGGLLSSITDPAGRVTSFTHSGSDLTAAKLPDGSTWNYAYSSAGLLSTITNPLSQSDTIAYDAAGRVSTITRPDSSVDTYTNDQEQGWTNSGTSTSPAPAILLAAAYGSFTNALGATTDVRPDWSGLGMIGQTTDPLGDVTTYNLNLNGLALVTIDPLNNITQETFNASGDMTQEILPDLSSTYNYTYNSYSEPTSKTDPLGDKWTYYYNTAGDMTSEVDALGYTTSYTYTPSGMVASTTDANGNTTDYAYNSYDEMTTQTNPDGSTITYTYTISGQIASTTNELGGTTTNTYDAMNRLLTTTNPLGDKTSFAFDSGGELISETDPLGNTWTFTYNSMDELASKSDPLGDTYKYGYDAAGNQTTVTDPLGNTTTTAYNALNQPISTTDALGNKWTRTYDANGDLLTSTDPLGNTTTYTYTQRGELASVTDPMGNVQSYVYSAIPGQELAWKYSSNNYGYGVLANINYNADGEVTSKSNSLGETTSYSYDKNGNVLSVTDPNGNKTTYTYNSRNWLTSTTNALGDVTSYGYDSAGDQTSVTDANGNTTTYAFNKAQQLTSQTDALGGVVSYTYTADGQMASLTDPVGNVTSWAYDAAGREISQTNPLGTSYDVYNADSQLIKYTDNNGQVKTYAYNADGWKTTENWLNASGSAFWTETTTYNADGKVTEVTNPSSTLTYTYNADMLMASVSTAGTPGQPSVTLSYAYNAVNLISSVSDNIQSGDTTTYGYDAAFHLTSIAQTIGGSAGPQISIGYDSGGRLTSQSRTIGGTGTQIVSTIDYNAANEITSILHQYSTSSSGGSGGTTYATINSYSYGYDIGGLLTTQTNNDGTFNYSYDKTNQLTGVTGPWNESFSYDLNGNRTMSGYTTGKDNEMLTDAAGNKYTYDANGNMTSMTTPSGDVWTYTWNYRNEMTGFSEKNSSGTVIASGTYTYDSLDRRIGVDETSGGTTTQTWIVYNGDSNTPYAQFNGSGTLLERYLAGPSYVPGVTGMIARTNASGVTDWYVTGKLGSVRDIVNTSGTVIDHISYGAFGSIRSETNPSSGSQFKFDGMVYDMILSYYFDNARYYESISGRFTSLDPKSFYSGIDNLYIFTSNNPLNIIDNSGFQGESGNGQYTPATINDGKKFKAIYEARQKSLINYISEYEKYLKHYKQTAPETTIEIGISGVTPGAKKSKTYKEGMNAMRRYRYYRRLLLQYEYIQKQREELYGYKNSVEYLYPQVGQLPNVPDQPEQPTRKPALPPKPPK